MRCERWGQSGLNVAAYRNTLGTLLVSLGRFGVRPARHSLRPWAESPNAAWALNNLCFVDLQEGRLADARSRCEAAVARAPEFRVARQNLGRTLAMIASPPAAAAAAPAATQRATAATPPPVRKDDAGTVTKGGLRLGSGWFQFWRSEKTPSKWPELKLIPTPIPPLSTIRPALVILAVCLWTVAAWTMASPGPPGFVRHPQSGRFQPVLRVWPPCLDGAGQRHLRPRAVGLGAE